MTVTEEQREKSREYYAKILQKDPMFFRLRSGKERARNAGAEWQDITTAELLSHWKRNNMSIDICHYCKQTINEGELEIDHAIPIERGGPHAMDNLFPAHRKCNREKRDKTMEEYHRYLEKDPIYIRLKLGKSRAKEAGVSWKDISLTDLMTHWQQEGIDAEVCYYCRRKVNIDDFRLGHGIPLSKEGDHSIDNLYPCHHKCNREKGDRNVEEYLNYLKRIETRDNSWYQSLTASQKAAVDAFRYKRKKGQPIGGALRKRLSRVPELV